MREAGATAVVEFALHFYFVVSRRLRVDLPVLSVRLYFNTRKRFHTLWQALYVTDFRIYPASTEPGTLALPTWDLVSRRPWRNEMGGCAAVLDIGRSLCG